MKRIYQACWRFRPPPENTKNFYMCGSPQQCIFGNGCTSAHSVEELKEWQVRRASQLRQPGKTEMEKKHSTPLIHIQSIKNTINESRKLGLPAHVMITEVSGKQRILCKQCLFVTHLDKNKEIIWEFNINVQPASNGSIHGLQNVFFLEDNSNEFSFAGLCLHPNEKFHQFNENVKEISLETFSRIPPNYAVVTVKFSSTCYGNFNVSVIFDFGYAPRIVRYIGVVVAPEKHLVETLSLKPNVGFEQNNELTWLAKHKLVPFDSNSVEKQRSAESPYKLPSNLEYGVKYGAFEHLDVELTRDNYRDRLHTLLYVEEYERRKRMSRLNVHCDDIFALFREGPRPRSLRNVDMKKTLFIAVAEEVLEEVGILISRGSKALLRIRQFVYGAPGSQDYVIHEALVVNILSDEILVEISSKTLSLLSSMAAPVPVDICFRFVDTFLCMHSAIDRVNLDLIFNHSETTELSRSIPTLPHSVLSPAQASVISRLLKLPPGAPILLLGPFGTGKTQTLAEAVKILIGRMNAKPSNDCRILICTHSNSAADHYIENYLHPVFEELQRKDASVEKPLRVYWEHRLAMTISEKMMPYCIMDLNNGTFRNPLLEELKRKMIIVTTLVTADMLTKCGVKPGFFSHIFIDEAAQAMELETLVPVSLATKETKIVLAGDHLQLSPPVFSAVGRKLLLDKSLLVRLYESSPVHSPRKLVLLENYRSYKEIVDIPSKLFYEGSLISKKSTPIGLSFPVQFYGVQGLEEKANDSLSYINMAEVAEISDRVDNMIKLWPEKEWGKINLQKTCVLCAHHAQIRQIRRDLRFNGFHDVRVENVYNVQGLEFDVLFLSTVRTSRNLAPGQHEGKDLGLLSNPKLLNTAITRAKYSLVIVGDPEALCSVGDCRVCWKTILSLCSEKGTFHYRFPLYTILDNIRKDQAQLITQVKTDNQGMPLYSNPLIPQISNNLRSTSSFQTATLNSQVSPASLEKLVSHQVWFPQHTGNISPIRPREQINRFPLFGQRMSSYVSCPPLPVGSRALQRQIKYIPPFASLSSTGLISNGNCNSTMKLPYLLEEKQPTFNQNNVPQETMASTSEDDVIKTLRNNIRTTLKLVLDNEEAVETCIEQPLEDISLKIKENLKRQLTLIRSQKSQIEQQQRLNNQLEKAVHEWRQTFSNEAKNVDCVEILEHSQNNQPASKTVQKIDLCADHEVREWYRERRQDPIVQDYIKSFEALSKRARKAWIEFAEKPITETCPITRVENGSGDSLRGWVLQPDSVSCASGSFLHEEHISKEEAKQKIENGELVSCSFIVDRGSGGNSAVGALDDPLKRNICIPDRKSMNRAFNGDYVAVEITDYGGRSNDQRHGKVVAILKERHHRQVVCRLSSSASNFMIPLNNANPKFLILQSENYVGKMGVAVFGSDGSTIKFQDFISDTKDKLFLVHFLQWDASYKFPLGFVVNCFIESSNPANALLVLCADHGIQSEFPAEVVDQVNVSFPADWQIPEEERRSRRRYDDVFTIDVEGAEELDDAVSVRPESYGVYCVTVHVADVSYFVSKGSLLDKVAERRGTSIYLPDYFSDSIPLLPRRLSHDLCSLVPGEERLAVSVEFMIDSNGKQLGTAVFHRSIVISQQRFNYNEVDMFVTQKAKVIHNSKMTLPLLKSLQILYCLSQEIWCRRVRTGSYQANTGAIDKPPSQRIIEELMVLCNVAVADKLAKLCDNYAVPFRLQASPKYHAVEDLVLWAAEKGLNVQEMFVTKWLSEFQVCADNRNKLATVSVKLDTWKSICQAIKLNNMVDLTTAILTVHEGSPLVSIVASIKRFMPKSKYVSSSQYSPVECQHFALSTDYYTHFTSPIRRFFDIVVHRVLLSALKSMPIYGNDELRTLCDNLNLTCEKVNAFSKQCSTMVSTTLLHEVSPWRSMVVETPNCDHLVIRNNEDDAFSLPIKLHTKDMGVSIKEWNAEVHELVVSWSSQDVDLQNGVDTGGNDLTLNTSPEQFTASVSNTVVRVPTDLWCQLLDASKAENLEALMECQGSINESAVISLNSEYLCNEDDGVSVSVDQFGVCSVTRFFRRGDTIKGLFGSNSSNGFSQPFLQAIQVAPRKICCIQHNQKPVECFTRSAKLRMRERFSSVDEYLWVHIPLLMMESAMKSVSMCASPLQLRNSTIEWLTDSLNDQWGTLRIQIGLLMPLMKIHKDDFVCVRAPTAVCHGQVQEIAAENNELVVKLILLSPGESRVNGLCTVEVIPHCISYRRMISAVRSLINATEDIRSLILKRDLYPPTQHGCRNCPLSLSFALDSHQMKTVDAAINSRLTLIEGLPGTGKTYTAAAIVEQFFLQNLQVKSSPSNVLFCCPTNKAIDIAASMLSRFSPNVPILRVYARNIEMQSFPEVGIAYGVPTVHKLYHADMSLEKQALHFKIRSNSNPFKSIIEKCAQQVNALQHSSFNREQFSLVIKEYRRVVKMAEEYELSENASQVILCTCIEVGSSRMRNYGKVKQCVIDESNMCLEAESLVVFQAITSTCNRIVLVGDCEQLAPTVQNKTARRFGLGKSLFQSLLDDQEKKSFSHHSLDTHYRMHPSIGQLTASVFYNGQSFKNSRTLTTRPDLGQFNLFCRNNFCRVVVYHICGDEQPNKELDGEYGQELTMHNEAEVKKVIEIVNDLKENGVNSVQISILTPYFGQEHLVKTYLNERDLKDIRVCSFIAAQGSENDFVIISTVRSLSQSKIVPSSSPEWLEVYLGVLTDKKQANVALTRARHGLVLIGNQDLLSVCPGWSNFITLCKANDCVVSEFS